MRRLFRVAAGILASAAAIASTAAGIFLAEIRIHVPRKSLPAIPAAVEEIAIRTSDGVELHAWLAKPPSFNGDAVILLHGVADNRAGMTGYAEMLQRHGFAVLLPDARGHGESGGEA